ncbi:hypothetical protein [Neobacillus sp. SAB-20_R2A]
MPAQAETIIAEGLEKVKEVGKKLSPVANFLKSQQIGVIIVGGWP